MRRQPGVTLRPLDGPADFAACLELQERTWGRGFAERVPPSILRIARDLGGVASGAFDGEGRLIGFVFGVTGWVDGAPLHWSDMLAVAPDARDLGIGQALKLHQREYLLQRGVTTVEWTFDPLEARNGRLNLSRLGATARSYRRDYYEGSDSPVHADIGTDRLIVTWHLSSRRVADRVAGASRPPVPTTIRALPALNPITDEAAPACAPPGALPDSAALRIAVPADIQTLKANDRALAVEWRAHTRTAFERAFEAGFEARELVRVGAVAWYVLERID